MTALHSSPTPRAALAAAALVLLVALGCASNEAPEARAPTPTEKETPAPAPPEIPQGERLEAWQEPFAAKRDKTVRDYYMLLPEHMFTCELPNGPKSEAERQARIGKLSLANGYLTAGADGAMLEVALYKDRTNGRDVIGTVRNTGVGDMCNIREFSVFNEETQRWTEVDVLPEAEIEVRIKAIEAQRGQEVFWWPELPAQGTDTDLVDENGARLLTLKWQGGRFVLP